MPLGGRASYSGPTPVELDLQYRRQQQRDAEFQALMEDRARARREAAFDKASSFIEQGMALKDVAPILEDLSAQQFMALQAIEKQRKKMSAEAEMKDPQVRSALIGGQTPVIGPGGERTMQPGASEAASQLITNLQERYGKEAVDPYFGALQAMTALGIGANTGQVEQGRSDLAAREASQRRVIAADKAAQMAAARERASLDVAVEREKRGMKQLDASIQEAGQALGNASLSGLTPEQLKRLEDDRIRFIVQSGGTEQDVARLFNVRDQTLYAGQQKRETADLRGGGKAQILEQRRMKLESDLGRPVSLAEAEDVREGRLYVSPVTRELVPGKAGGPQYQSDRSILNMVKLIGDAGSEGEIKGTPKNLRQAAFAVAATGGGGVANNERVIALRREFPGVFGRRSGAQAIYQTMVGTLANLLVKALQDGRISDQDYKNAKALMPFTQEMTLGADGNLSPDVAANFDALNTVLTTIASTPVGTYADGGTDVVSSERKWAQQVGGGKYDEAVRSAREEVTNPGQSGPRGPAASIYDNLLQIQGGP